MRTHIYILSLLFCLCAQSVSAQINLVPNPSFEDTINIHPGCRQNPHGCTLDEFIFDWRGRAVYFSEIFDSSSAPLGANISRSVPSNCVGYQSAHSGISYVTVTTYSLNVNGLSARNYVQCKLIQKLEAGRKYKAEFYVSRADSLRMSNNTVGVYFSVDSFSVQDWSLVDVIPQIQNDLNNSLNNDTGWVLVTDTMVADGTEEYITIGNFRPDSLSDTLSLGGACTIPGGATICSSLYYIDDVSVTLIDDTGLEESSKPLLHFYPNPIKAILNIENPGRRIRRLQVLSVSGAVLQQREGIEASKIIIDLSSLAPGLYFLHAEFEYGGVSVGKLIKE
jgi:OmpA-OmpF porin, OOP family